MTTLQSEGMFPIIGQEEEPTKRCGKPNGSLAFGTSIIRTEEYILIASVMSEAGETPEDIALGIECLDDCLAAQRLISVMARSKKQIYTASGRVRKGTTYMDFLNRRFDKLLGDLNNLKAEEQEQ